MSDAANVKAVLNGVRVERTKAEPVRGESPREAWSYAVHAGVELSTQYLANVRPNRSIVPGDPGMVMESHGDATVERVKKKATMVKTVQESMSRAVWSIVLPLQLQRIPACQRHGRS